MPTDVESIKFSASGSGGFRFAAKAAHCIEKKQASKLYANRKPDPLHTARRSCG